MSRYVMAEVELRAVQLTQLELLQEVDRICRKCDIHYNIIAGTLLGAVRHRGFIPWDDDADVALLREEYDKFCEVCKTELNHEKYYFQDHKHTEGYRWGYGKLRKKNTQFVREHQEDMPYEQGIFIDIFPLDNVPQNRLHRMVLNFKYYMLRKCMWAPIGVKSSSGFVERTLYKCLNKISDKMIYKCYNNCVEKSKKIKSDWVRILTYPTPTKDYAYKRIWYEHSKQIEFENIMFSGIKDYDEYLTFKFGQYMQLPPEEKRKIHAVSCLKL